MAAENISKIQSFKLKGRFFTFTVLQLQEVLCEPIIKQLIEVIAQAPKLFENTPVVLDCSNIESEALDLSSLCQEMRAQGVMPIAIQGGSPFLQTCARALGLAVLNASATHDKSLDLYPETTTILQSTKSKRVSGPVRSGQQIVSKNADLIITSSVSHGAEVLSEGSIHIYGALRGKALAGIGGDRDARIFCQALDAELVSIAGFYLVRETLQPMSAPCQIYLQDDQLKIDPL
jgi:septum site-determining protein MinC